MEAARTLSSSQTLHILIRTENLAILLFLNSLFQNNVTLYLIYLKILLEKKKQFSLGGQEDFVKIGVALQ
jgi:hypothetical protein